MVSICAEPKPQKPVAHRVLQCAALAVVQNLMHGRLAQNRKSACRSERPTEKRKRPIAADSRGQQVRQRFKRRQIDMGRLPSANGRPHSALDYLAPNEYLVAQEATQPQCHIY